MLLFIRLLPYVTAFGLGFLSWSQRKQPMLYPWLSILGIGLFLASIGFIVWRKMTIRDVVEKMAPTFFLQCALAFGLLLVETDVALWTIHILTGLTTFLSLELLFLLAFEPDAYPVNGLSRLNIAFVPLISWYAVSTSSGLVTFLHTPHAMHVAMCALIGMVLYRTTGHPGATPAQNVTWTSIGLLVGLHVGWIGLHLPVTMPMQGVVAAVLFTGILRMRRYVYVPKPTRQVAWIEGISVVVFFIVAMSTAKWL